MTRLSLKDIADELKLSKTTVSWVLSGQAVEKKISKSTADRVLAYAKKINYQPDMIARSLSAGETRTIGLILPSISDSFYSEIAKEIESIARINKYSLMISSSESDFDREVEIIQMFKSKRVDGIVIAPTANAAHEIECLIAEEYPLVTIDRYFPELQANYIVVDNFESCYELTKHLISKSCKNIAILTTDSNLITMNQRKSGYVQALLDSGYDVNTDLIVDVDYIGYKKNVFDELDELFAKNIEVDGFLFTTHILALEAFQYFYDHQITVDFEMASIHELPIFKVLSPKMNVAKMPVAEIGKMSMEILLGQINSYKKKTVINNSIQKPKKLILSCALEYRS